MKHRFDALKRVFEKYERGAGIALRVLADLVMVNIAMLGAFEL